MLITDRFVMINFPKTGSSFAREAIQRAHTPDRLDRLFQRWGLMGPMWEERLMGQIHFNEELTRKEVRMEAHGAYRQIPEEHRHKKIMSVVRDPLERMVSTYLFKSWAAKPKLHLERMREHFPHWPELSFADYFHLNMHLALAEMLPKGMRTQVGPQTMQFIRFFAYDPLRTMLSLRDDTDLMRERKHHFPQVVFLHTENLNEELYNYLRARGLSRSRIGFIKAKERSNVTPRTRPAYFTEAMREEFLQAERFLYQLFPEYLPT